MAAMEDGIHHLPPGTGFVIVCRCSPAATITISQRGLPSPGMDGDPSTSSPGFVTNAASRTRSRSRRGWLPRGAVSPRVSPRVPPRRDQHAVGGE